VIEGGPASTPELSAILPTADGYESIRETVRHLRFQTVVNRIELVVVVSSTAGLEAPPPEFESFAGHRVVEVGRIVNIAQAYAVGVRHATAPLVALCEDHSFPDPGWAAALIEAHRGPWAAVGPVIRNGNPGNRVSWADLVTSYLEWLAPAVPGERGHLPGHNSSYKREVLLASEPGMESALASETAYHWRLRARGHRLYLEPRAVTAHLNFGLLRPWLAAKFLSGRVFASARSRDWTGGRRALYVAASPLIPVMRLARVVSDLASGPSRRMPRGVIPTAALGLLVSGLGEMAGYACGVGNALPRLAAFEFNRVRYLGKSGDPR
jgi:GT2 family glycosyltransferase